jgi:CRISPR-associated protein Csh2
MSEVKRNSEILFLYDAKLCNPNGDPDEENKPRMDYETRRNLVSDVRLKRYLRDYWIALAEEAWKKLGYPEKQDVWVRQIEESTGNLRHVSAKERIDALAQEFAKAQGKPPASRKELKELIRDREFVEWLLRKLVDVRLFGATMPIGEAEGEAGAALTLTGPVQFTWGYSLNRAEILPSSTISSQFAGREGEEKGRYGTFGKDWRIKYSLLAFYGTISAWRAQYTRLTEQDVLLLDRSIVEALPLLATTRSKLGQTARLYLRLEYRDDQTFLGDLRAGLKLNPEEGLEDIADVKLDFSELLAKIRAAKDRIEKVVLWVHPDFASGKAFEKELANLSILKQG